MTNKDKQLVYDAIKLIRQGETVSVNVDGKPYRIEPWTNYEQHADGYCQTVLCKHGKGRAQRINIATICWKDAGPNPKLLNVQGGFIPFDNIYGVVVPEGN